MIQFVNPKKEKRGISTVLGVLLMVGILFTTVIPLFIYVNTVDNYYDRTVVNLGIADQERSMENIDMYAFGQSESENVTVFIINKGSVTINVTHVWVMKTDLNKTLVFTSENVSEPLNGATLPLQLIPSAQLSIQNLSLITMPLDTTVNVTEYFNVYVTTARGNKFPPKTITHTGGGGWGLGENPPWIEIFVRDTYSDADIYQFEVTSEFGFYAITTSYKVGNDYYTIVPTWEYGLFNVTATNIQENPAAFLGWKTVMLVVENPVGLADFIDVPPKAPP